MNSPKCKVQVEIDKHLNALEKIIADFRDSGTSDLRKWSLSGYIRYIGHELLRATYPWQTGEKNEMPRV